MIKIGNSEPREIYVGSTAVSEIWRGGVKVWPTTGVVTYDVDNFALSGSFLYVDQSNYITITARLRTYVDGTLTSTETVTTTPAFVSGTNRHTISSGRIYFNISTYGTTVFGQSTAQFKGSYTIGGQTYTSENLTVTLQANSRSATSSRNVSHQKIPGTSYRDYRNWYAYISATSYTSSSSRCPAGGGGSTLVISGHHEESTATPWTQDIDTYTTYTYTSGQTKEEYTSTRQSSGIDHTTWETYTDTLTPTMSAPSGGFTRSGNVVTIASEGKTTYTNGRTATFTVTNGTETDSVTIYQAANTSTTTRTHTIDLTTSSAAIDYIGGQIRVNYVSTYTDKTVWTSGEEETSSPQATASDLTTQRGTLSSDRVSGTGYVTLTVPRNDTYSAISFNVIITSPLGTTKTLTFTQAAQEHPKEWYIEVTESTRSGYRDVTIKNNYTSTLSGYVQCDIYDDYGTFITSTQISFNLAAGETKPATRINYGYGYSVNYTKYVN